eukprot:symbB.v1.2.039241.t1/scaffold6435.1/size21805/2
MVPSAALKNAIYYGETVTAPLTGNKRDRRPFHFITIAERLPLQVVPKIRTTEEDYTGPYHNMWTLEQRAMEVAKLKAEMGALRDTDCDSDEDSLSSFESDDEDEDEDDDEEDDDALRRNRSGFAKCTKKLFEIRHAVQQMTAELFHDIFQSSKEGEASAATCCDVFSGAMRSLTQYTNCC